MARGGHFPFPLFFCRIPELAKEVDDEARGIKFGRLNLRYYNPNLFPRESEVLVLKFCCITVFISGFGICNDFLA